MTSLVLPVRGSTDGRPPQILPAPLAAVAAHRGAERWAPVTAWCAAVRLSIDAEGTRRSRREDRA